MHQPTETGNNLSAAGITRSVCLVDTAVGNAVAQQLNSSILFAGDGCFISVHDKLSRTFLALLHYRFGLSRNEAYSVAGYSRYMRAMALVKQDCVDLRLTLQNLHTTFTSTRNTLVPGAYFNPDDGQKCFSMNYKALDGEIIKHEYVRAIDAYNVFGLPAVIQDIVDADFNGSTIHSVNAQIINALLIRKHLADHKQMHLDADGQSLKVIVTESEKLLYCNDFEVHTAEDIAYYAVFVAGQLNLQSGTPVWLSGEISNGSQAQQLLSNYLGSTGFEAQPRDILLASALRKVTWNEFFTLFSISLCE